MPASRCSTTPRSGGGYSGDVVLHRAPCLSVEPSRRRQHVPRTASGSTACATRAVRGGSRLRPDSGDVDGEDDRPAVATRFLHGRPRRDERAGLRAGSFRGFALYDVTRPGTAARARACPHRPARLARDLAPAGGPRAPTSTRRSSPRRSSPPGRHDPGQPDFRIFDVTRPTQPVVGGGWGAWEELGLVPFRDPSKRLDGNFVHSVVGDGSRASSPTGIWAPWSSTSRPRRAPRYLGRTRGAATTPHSAWLGRAGPLVETHEAGGGVGALLPARRRPIRCSSAPSRSRTP